MPRQEQAHREHASSAQAAEAAARDEQQAQNAAADDARVREGHAERTASVSAAAEQTIHTLDEVLAEAAGWTALQAA